MDVSNAIEVVYSDSDSSNEQRKKRGPGQPCKYETHVKPYLEEIEAWLKEGIVEYEIYQKLGVNRQSWIDYKDRYPEFSELFKKAKESIACQIKNAMIQKATGFTKQVEKLDKQGNRVYVEEYFAPDTTAGIFMLCNLDRENFQQRVTTNNVFIQQNNVQIDDIKKQIGLLLEEYKNLEAIDITGTKERGD